MRQDQPLKVVKLRESRLPAKFYRLGPVKDVTEDEISEGRQDP